VDEENFQMYLQNKEYQTFSVVEDHSSTSWKKAFQTLRISLFIFETIVFIIFNQ